MTARSDGASSTSSVNVSRSYRPLSPPTSLARAPRTAKLKIRVFAVLTRYRRTTSPAAASAGEPGLAVDQHHVAVPAHRDVIRPGPAERRDVPVLHQQVIQGQGQLPVRGGPVGRVGGLDHDRAVQAHLQAEVFADVRVIPVEPGVGELELVGEGPADRDRLLGLVRDPVVAVVQPQPVPVHGRLDIAVIGYLHGDLRPLIDVQAGAGDRPVVGEHAQVSAVEALSRRADVQVKSVTVVEPGHVRARHLRQSRGLGGEQVLRVWDGHGRSFRVSRWWLYRASASGGWRADRSRAA